MMFVKRISQAVAWTRLLLSGLIRDQDGKPVVVARWFSVAHRMNSLQVCIRTDASPDGMGAILLQESHACSMDGAGLVARRSCLSQGEDRRPSVASRVGTVCNSHCSGCLAPAPPRPGRVLIASGCHRSFFSAARLAGRTPAMNAIAVEIAIRLESAEVTLSPEHLRGALNFECDALSRLAQGAAIPERLQGVQRSLPRPRQQQFFWAACHKTTRS